MKLRQPAYSPNKSLRTYIQIGEVKSLYDSLPVAIISNLLVSITMFIIIRSEVPIGRISLFLAFVWITNLLRGLIFFLRKKTKFINNPVLLKILFTIGLVISSMVWGSTALFILPGCDLPHQLFITLIIAGLAAGGLSSLFAVFALAFTYIQLLLVPLAVSFFLLDNPSHYETAFLIILFNVFISLASLKLSIHFKKNLRLEFRYINASEKLKLSEQRYETIFNEALIGIFYYNSRMIVKECNAGLARIMQTSIDNLKNLDLRQLPDKRVLPSLEIILENRHGYYEGPYHTIKSDIDLFVSMRTTPITDSEGRIKGGVAIIEDVTEKIQTQKEIKHRADHDALTGLPNRQLLTDRLSQALKSAQRHDHLGAVLYLDLDKFKLINDSMGHQAGDLLLKEVAQRLLSVLRAEDTLSRLGGDEFVVLLPELSSDSETSANYARLVADKLHKELSSAISFENYTLSTSTSIGVVIFKGDETSGDVLKYADIAMYHAKERGRNRTSFYHSQMEEIMQKQLVLEVDLRQALRNDELEIYYQPIVSLKDNLIVGAEALLRWNHPERGFISPEEIIGTAEKTGQILPLGKWILDKVLSDYAEWIQTDILNLDYISINVSIKQMLQANFVEETLSSIEKYQISHERIVLEITESILITDFNNTVGKMRALRNAGVQFALDDFGTGYSSLSYLKKLPLDKLKIDRAFTENLMVDKDDYVLVQTIIGMADHFNLSVITEGVETAEQLNILTEMGCPLYQGYYCSKPVTAEDFILFTKNFNSR